jgi:DNA-binding response OmpR family regulator
MGKILIVDDEPSILEVLQRYLKMKGFETLEAQTGENALQLLASEKVSAVLLDMHLNTVQGLGLLTQFFTLNPGLRVIMMSGSEDDNDVKAALALGACGYILKPFDFTQLETLIKKTQG